MGSGLEGLSAEVGTLLAILVIAEAAGWIAGMVVETGVHIRGITFFCGLIGLQAGAWATQLTEWHAGPTVAGYALFPTFAGAMVIAGLLKLVSLGVEGSRV